MLIKITRTQLNTIQCSRNCAKIAAIFKAEWKSIVELLLMKMYSYRETEKVERANIAHITQFRFDNLIRQISVLSSQQWICRLIRASERDRNVSSCTF